MLRHCTNHVGMEPYLSELVGDQIKNVLSRPTLVLSNKDLSINMSVCVTEVVRKVKLVLSLPMG